MSGNKIHYGSVELSSHQHYNLTLGGTQLSDLKFHSTQPFSVLLYENEQLVDNNECQHTTRCAIENVSGPICSQHQYVAIISVESNHVVIYYQWQSASCFDVIFGSVGIILILILLFLCIFLSSLFCVKCTKISCWNLLQKRYHDAEEDIQIEVDIDETVLLIGPINV